MKVYENGNGPLVYPVTLKDGTYIGYVQAVPFDDGTWEIGYHIGISFTKQGYATEAVAEFLPVIIKVRSGKSVNMYITCHQKEIEHKLKHST